MEFKKQPDFSKVPSGVFIDAKTGEMTLIDGGWFIRARKKDEEKWDCCSTTNIHYLWSNLESENIDFRGYSKL